MSQVAPQLYLARWMVRHGAVVVLTDSVQPIEAEERRIAFREKPSAHH